MTRTIVPDIVQETQVHSVTEATTVKEAAEVMNRHHVAALVVLEGDRLVGIFTERDVTDRVVAVGADPNTTTVGATMTRDPDTVAPDAAPTVVLDAMVAHDYRHMPVVKDGKVMAMVSVRDLFRAVREQLERDIRQRDQYIFGEAYGQQDD